MNRYTLRSTICSIIVTATAVFGICTEVKAEPEAEYLRNRCGLTVHYTYGWGGGHRYPGTCNADGSIPKSLDEVADKFDGDWNGIDVTRLRQTVFSRQPDAALVEIAPPPADGKRFAAAKLLRSGRKVNLRQDAKRVILKLPNGDRGDSPDAVIKLTAARVSAAKETKYRWNHKPGAELALRAGEKTIWAYHFKADGGFPYVHPLATAEGTCLTALAPDDHPWHRAVWFSWKYLNGVNYWNWEGKSKQPIPPGRTVPVGKETVTLATDRARIAMNLLYTSEGRTVLTEKREIVIRLPRDDGSYTMDWRANFTAAAKDVVLDRTPIPGQPGGAGHGGYAGLSFRGAASLREVHALDSEGRRDKQGHGKAARWLDYHAVIDEKGRTAGVTIFDHPDNFRHPSPWYISFGGMPYFSPAPIFHKPYTLSAGDTLTLRYRILVHRGRGDPQILEREYKDFSSSK